MSNFSYIVSDISSIFNWYRVQQQRLEFQTHNIHNKLRSAIYMIFHKKLKSNQKKCVKFCFYQMKAGTDTCVAKTPHAFSIYFFYNRYNTKEQVGKWVNYLFNSVFMFEFCKVICRFWCEQIIEDDWVYPNDFIDVSEVLLRHQLMNYITNVRFDQKFAKLKGLSDLCAKLVETNKYNTFAIVYKLLKLTLLLPVATASV